VSSRRRAKISADRDIRRPRGQPHQDDGVAAALEQGNMQNWLAQQQNNFWQMQNWQAQQQGNFWDMVGAMR
jgi:hypothetical protein